MKFIKLPFISYISFLIFSSNIHVSASEINDSGNKKLEFINKIYEKNIKTAILYQAGDAEATSLFPAAIPLAQQIPLVLRFDEIYTDNADYYKAKIIHCDYNWLPSGLPELQYLNEYNEFVIDQYEFSIATKVPYTHFVFQVPKVKLPGNYLLVVYREPDENDIIITRRFVVYDNKVSILARKGVSTGIAERRLNQQIDFEINYSNFPIQNPYLDIQVVIKQNDRWDNAIFGLKPTTIKEDIYKLEYRHFDFQNNFRAGNEFRFFDIRSTHYGGRNVEKTDITDTRIDAYLYFDKSRGFEPYSYIRDLNGGFIIQNSEGRDNFLESDYIYVHFFLRLDEKLNQDIFVSGKLTDWRYGNFNKMKYIEASGLYHTTLLLKQGLYDFIYYIPKNKENPYLLEGNHYETRNDYEILVYYKSPMYNTYLLVGYVRF